MDRMLDTAEIMRGRHRFRGHIHLKIIPGSRPDQVERAMALSTRVSVNMDERYQSDAIRRLKFLPAVDAS